MSERVKKIARRALFGSSVVSAAVISSYMTSKLLVDTAIDKEMPKAMNRIKPIITGRVGDKEFLDELEEKSKWLEAQKNEVIEITAHDGAKLKAHWIPVRHPKRILIAMHGWRSSWHRDFGTVAESWFANDCSVLFCEQRGQNDSDGEYMGFGMTERFDVQDWAKYIEARFGRRVPVYLVGVSMGAATVLMASGLELPKNVRGIIADCGFTSPNAVWDHVVKNNLHIGGLGLAHKFADGIFREKTDMDLDDYSTVDALKTNELPVFFVHGTKDPLVPVEMTYENYLACHSEKELLIVPGAGHGMSYYTEPDKYEEMTIEFFKKHDRK
ncbi:MAG: alpha/beta hydrolase [Clostridia bacterium]|nr:alpha/beta hydrolase [Clostridia bacterium]